MSEQEYLEPELPDNRLDAYWVSWAFIPEGWKESILKEAKRVVQSPGWNPKIVKLQGSFFMIDLCFNFSEEKSQSVHSILIASLEDHPLLKELPANAPRAVKALYRKEIRLKHARTEDFFTVIQDWYTAEDAWYAYLDTRVR